MVLVHKYWYFLITVTAYVTIYDIMRVNKFIWNWQKLCQALSFDILKVPSETSVDICAHFRPHFP